MARTWAKPCARDTGPENKAGDFAVARRALRMSALRPSCSDDRPQVGERADLLAQAVDRAMPMIADGVKPTKERIRFLWAAVKAARALAASDAVHDAFMAVATKTNLIDATGCWTGSDVAEHRRHYGREDTAHVIRWALRGWNPFEQGSLT
jgi:hypothetical protein